MNEKDVIIACDFSSAEETLTFLDRFGGKKPYVKIGMELYYAAGPDMVRRILERGHRVFLDLKLHDIPNTVRKAMKNLARLGVHMTNLHAAGGRKMMQAAVEGLAEGAAEPSAKRMPGVTVRKPCPLARLTAAASCGEQTTPSSPLCAALAA